MTGRFRKSSSAGAFVLTLLGVAPLVAQNPAPPVVMDHVMPAAQDMMMRAREGSGTAWLPDSSPMAALHASTGTWGLMLHGNGFLQYIYEPGQRGGSQLVSLNWLMGMARRPLIGGVFGLRAMLSAEPFTIPGCGYPLLLQSGESCDGEPLHDVQHPHDLFTELAAEYTRPVLSTLDLNLYVALAGEPALGPVAFPHRWSAMPNPLAPISHHWFDGSHITFGVLTAGLNGERWKLEGSVFNGRTPDEDRLDLDLAALSSFAGRIWWLPSERWSLQLSAGRFDGEDGSTPEEPISRVTRLTTSATYHQRLGERGLWATTLAAGRSVVESVGGDAILLESSLTLDERHTFFGRGEWAEKSGTAGGHSHESPASAQDALLNSVGALAVGYTIHLPPFQGWLAGVGARTSMSFLPADLEPIYQGRTPTGFTVFVNLRPAETIMDVMSMPMADGRAAAGSPR
jgi:hypothetical protein